KDQPAFTHIRVRQFELVAQEGTQRFWLGRIEHGVHAANHVRAPRVRFHRAGEHQPLVRPSECYAASGISKMLLWNLLSCTTSARPITRAISMCRYSAA